MFRILFFVTLIACLSALVSAEVTVSSDRLEIYEDESFLLTVRVTPSAPINRSDINALESIFTVLSRGQSTQTATVNGQRTSFTEYQFRLAPKEKGLLGIPVFTVNGEQSDPFFINVKDATTRSNTLEDDAIIYNISVSNVNPYIDQTVQLTIEIAYRIALNGQFTKLNVPNFETGEQTEQQRVETRQGKSYNVYTLTLPITPRQAGEFSLPDIVFSGQYQVSNSRPAKRITLSAKPDTITVKPIPSDYPAGAFWLPVLDLTISDNLTDNLILETGEHLDWNITQAVEGISANLLPDPLKGLEDNPMLQLYRDNPVFDDNNNAQSTRKDIAALSIKNNAGSEFVLPEVRIPWWNIKTDQLQFAVLPERIIKIKAASLKSSETSTDKNVNRPNLEPVKGRTWNSFTTVLFIALVVSLAINIWLFIKQRHRDQASKKPQPAQHPRVDASTIHEVYSALLNLVRSNGTSITYLKAHLSPETQKILNRVEGEYFGKTNEAACTLAQAKSVLAESMQFFKPNGQSAKKGFSVYPTNE